MSVLLNSGGRVGVSAIFLTLESGYIFRPRFWKISICRLEEEIKYIEELIHMGKDICGNNFAGTGHINTLNMCKTMLKKLKPSE
jgi:hypothetical protein